MFWPASFLVVTLAASIGAPVDGPLTGCFALHQRVIDVWLDALQPGTLVPWRAADGSEILLTEWRGAHLSLLTARSDYDPVLVQCVLDATDAYWVRCRDICGNSPPPDPEKGSLVDGRPMIVERVQRVPDALVSADEANQPVTTSPRGRALGLVGVARTSIATDELEFLLRGAATPGSRAPLGLRLPNAIANNFFFFDPELGAIAPTRDLATAYASLLAGHACESLGWAAPDENRSLDTELERYEQDAQATFAATVGAAGEAGAYDAESLWTAFLTRLEHASGRSDFVERLWRATAECPTAAAPEDAVANLVVAVSAASGADLSQRFVSWRFPVSSETKSRVREALAPTRLDVPKRTPRSS